MYAGHLPQPSRCCFSRSRMMRGYSPRPELFRKIRPLTSPTSTLVAWPATMVPIAPSRSSGIFRSLAKWFMVPNGRTPSVLPESMIAAATALIVPSPPPATTRSASPRAACCANATSSDPLPASEIRASAPIRMKGVGNALPDLCAVAGARTGIDDHVDVHSRPGRAEVCCRRSAQCRPCSGPPGSDRPRGRPSPGRGRRRRRIQHMGGISGGSLAWSCRVVRRSWRPAVHNRYPR